MSIMEVASELFLKGRVVGFEGWEKRGEEMMEAVSIALGFQAEGLHVCGSTKIGFSLQHARPFEVGHSDLDIAVISQEEARKFFVVLDSGVEFSTWAWPGLRTLSQVQEVALAYRRAGVARYDLVDDSVSSLDERLGRINEQFGRRFSRISVTVYESSVAFLAKQAGRIKHYVSGLADAGNTGDRAVGMAASGSAAHDSRSMREWLAGILESGYSSRELLLPLLRLISEVRSLVSLSRILLAHSSSPCRWKGCPAAEIALYYVPMAGRGVSAWTVFMLKSVVLHNATLGIGVRLIPMDAGPTVLAEMTHRFHVGVDGDFGVDTAVHVLELQTV